MRFPRHRSVDHATINRWVLKYAPELDLRIRPHLNPTNDSWRVDETYIEVKGEWKYLDRAMDSEGNANPPYPPTDRRGADVASPLPWTSC